jgi:cobalt-zinc-cadmium efflux system outer membrane protein
MRRTSLIFLILWIAADARAQVEPLSLEKAIEVFLDRNVEVIAARARIDRARAEQIAAGIRANPTLTLSAENLGFHTPPNAGINSFREFIATYIDVVELGGKRQRRQDVAQEMLSVAELNFQNGLREGTGEVRQSYAEALLARHEVEIAIEDRQTFEQLLRFNTARFDEGAISEGDLLKVRLERVKFDAAVRQAELVLAQAMVRLLEKLEEPDFNIRPLAGTLDLPLLNLSLERQMQAAFRNRPDLRAAEAEIQLAHSKRLLEESRANPNLSPFVGYKRIGSENTVLFGVAIPLPLRDRNQGGIARAAADEKIVRAEREVVDNRVRVEVELAFRSYEAARDQVTLFRDQLLLQADESQSITLAAYSEGAIELLPVLEAQRTRSEIRHHYFQTLFNYQLSLLQLELAIGGSVQP